MRLMFLLCAIVFFSQETAAYSRPSFRSIRDSASESTTNDPGWRMQFYHNDDWGLRVTYPASWNLPKSERGTSADNVYSFEYARLIPHDAGYGKRKNYILELYVGTWDIGKELNTSELDIFSQNQNMKKYQEFQVLNSEITELNGYPAVRYDISSMTGNREEYWISAGRYIYILGMRSLGEHMENDHFFFTDMVESFVLQPIALREPEEELVPEFQSDAMLFSDVSLSHPYYEAILWAKASGVIQGYTEGTFLPDRIVNRAEFLKIILEAAGTDISGTPPPNFPDVPPEAWYGPYIAKAQVLGIVQGYADGTFRPEQPVNVAEALKMAFMAFTIQTEEQSGEWYQRYLIHAQKNGILFVNSLNPGSDMKRKDVVWIVWKLIR